MEFPSEITAAQRRLAAALMAAALVLAWVENRSPLARALRAGTPWFCWTSLENQGQDSPRLFLAVYQPAQRALELIYFPKTARIADAQKLLGEQAGALAPPVDNFIQSKPASLPQADPVAAAKEWIMRQDWIGADLSSNIPFFDLLLAALEIRRFGADSLRPAWLPEPDSRREFIAGFLSSAAPESGRAVTAEVFNASGRKGLASQATKILRLSDVDVINYGNLAQRRAKTMIYDRTGRFQNAILVRQILGCSSADAVTQIAPKKMIDVTVIIAEDCNFQEN